MDSISSNVPLWWVDCFELKAVKTQQTLEKLLASPLTAQNSWIRGPMPGTELLPERTFYFFIFS